MLFVLRRICSIFSRKRFKSVGCNIVFDPISSSFSYKNIYIGHNVYIGPKAWFRASSGKIKIGDDVMFGPGVSILSGNHRFNVVGHSMRHLKKNDDWVDETIEIGSEVWVGANVIILDGVKIGEGAIIGAGSVVTKSIEPYSIVAGNPCRYIRSRFTDEEIKLHKEGLLHEKA